MMKAFAFVIFATAALGYSLWASAVDFSRFFLLIDGTGNLAKLVKASRSKTCLLTVPKTLTYLALAYLVKVKLNFSS